MDFKTKVFNFLKFNFGIPKPMNWGYPLMYCGITSILIFLARYAFFKAQYDFSATSLIGYSIFMPLLIVITLMIPAGIFSERNQVAMVGRYTGIGVLFLSFLSGIPMMLVNSSCHNIVSYFWLKLTNKTIYPGYFYLTSDNNTSAVFLRLLTETIIPAIGLSLFFFGLLWSRFKKEDRTKAVIIITVFFCLYSLNLIDIIGIAVIGWWMCFLRSTTENIWGPVAGYIGMKLTEIIFGNTLSQVDLTTIITYSDISSSYFYASVPAIFVAIILFALFMKMLNDFNYTYNSDLYGEDGVDEEMEEHNKTLPPFVRGINMAFIISIIAFIVLWVFIFKGMQL